MSVKLKKDLGLKDYLDLIAKQNEAIIDQLMIDPNAMTSAFRLTSHKQYKDSIKKYTIAQEIEKPEPKIEEEIGLNLDDYLDKNPTKSEGSPPLDNIGVVIGIVIAIIILFLIVLLSQQ